MTTVNPISNPGALSAADAAKASAAAQAAQGLGKDAFLKLLITQLQNQDPLNPADSTEFTAQLAQFSSLEQLSNINENLETLGLYQASTNNAQAVAFIGKEILAVGDTLELTAGKPVACEFELAAEAKRVVVSIYSESGKFIREQVMTGPASGRQSLNWDGMDLAGHGAPGGIYRFEVLAEGLDGGRVAVTPLTRGLVDGVRFENNKPVLIMGGREVAFADIRQVGQAAGAAPNG
jgi:flagellar basal-body rod modification protein FlgD